MSEPGPTARWFQMPAHVKAHEQRTAFAKCSKRFIFNHSGRRSYKTETFKRKLVLHCLTNDGRYLAGAPTHKQAKRIFWEDLKKLSPPSRIIGRPSESQLVIKYDTGAELLVAGLDAPDRIEGTPLHGSLLDEYGNMVERVWPEVIAPMLADTRGFGWFSGVPEGRNHYYDLIERLKRDPDVAVFHWPSWDMMAADEIERQRGLVDELTFSQEFGGEFVHFAGRAYYAFDQKTHCAALRESYDPAAPLILCFDFNVDPGVAAICQERILPNRLEGTAVIGEVFIPRNSNTEVVARKILDDWGDHQGAVSLYGDFTGGSRGSAKIQGSDWDIIKRILRPKFGARLTDRVQSNPPVKDRINAMNARLKAANGSIRMMVDPRHAPHVVKDLEGVTIIEGSAGEIDKNSAPQLTHMCFTGDTIVETERGRCRMDDLPPAGMVRGFRGEFVPYTNAGKTGENKDVVEILISDGSAVQCTPEHQWLTDEGWKCAKDLIGARIITSELVSQALTDRTSIERSSIGMMGRSGIFGARIARASNICTALFTRILTGQFQADSTSTISTATGQTIRLKIWNALRRSDTFRSMKRKTLREESVQGRQGWKRREKPQRIGTLAKRASHGIESMRVALRKMFNLAPSLSYVSIADVTSYRGRGSQSIAARNASPPPDTTLSETTENEDVRRAAEYLRRTNTPVRNIAAEIAPVALDVRPFGKADVYCLYVEGDGCFSIANGSVVSNSDGLGYYVAAEFGFRKHEMIVGHGARFA